jgi:hypothetical protein
VPIAIDCPRAREIVQALPGSNPNFEKKSSRVDILSLRRRRRRRHLGGDSQYDDEYHSYCCYSLYKN